MCRRKLLDSDNAQSGAKWIRDQVCRTIGIDDGSPLIEFEYHQIISKEVGTIVNITLL